MIHDHLRGLSLIETVVYLALVSMFLSGAFITTSLISDSVYRHQIVSRLTHESTFISHYLRRTTPGESVLPEKIPTRFFISDFSVSTYGRKNDQENPEFSIVEFVLVPSADNQTPKISTRIFHYPDAP